MENVESNWNDLDFKEPVNTPEGDDDADDDLGNQTNPPTTDVNGNPIIPDQGLQQNLPDDDDDEGEPVKPVKEGDDEFDDDPEGESSKKGDNDDTDDDESDTADQSGIELYLAQFDIEGGMINFEDGTSKHFDEVEPAKQAEILQQLHGNQSSSVEEKYGLVDDEIGLINYLRENKLSVQDMVESMAQERVTTLLALQQSETTNFDEMTDEAVYTRFLKESNPEDSAEDIETKLDQAKKLSSFANLSTALRTQYKGAQTQKLSEANTLQTQEREAALDAQRTEVVEAVVTMKDVAGIALNDNIKNSVLDRVLEVNESGDSVFMDEVFGDPKKLFTAAFWYYYGDNISKQRDDYWKKEKSAAYKRGKSDALGTSKPGISFNGQNKRTKTSTVTTKEKQDGDFYFED